MRLNRFLARAGVASRRRSDDLIRSGVVRVNEELAPNPARSVKEHDRVEVEGRIIELPKEFQYILLNKEAGRLVTRRDMRGRPTVFDALQELRPATVSVGRLDRDTTGVLLFTDDGELAHRLMHPRFEVEKRYLTSVRGLPKETALNQLRSGISLDDGITAPAQVRTLSRVLQSNSCNLELCVHEGRKHQIKRMCEAIGHRVTSLHRVAFAELTVADLRPGQSRSLRNTEILRLKSLVGL